MPIDGFGLDSFESELETVIARHNELLAGDEGDQQQALAFARAFAMLNAKMMDQGVEPGVDERSGVAHLEWPEQSTISFVGNTANPEWLDGEEIDVSRFTHVEIRGAGE